MSELTSLPGTAASRRPARRRFGADEGQALHLAALALGAAPRDLAAAIAGRHLAVDGADEEPRARSAFTGRAAA